MTQRRRKEKFAAEDSNDQLRPKNPRQQDYMKALRTAEMVVAVGPAGTGKTWLAANIGADLLVTHQINKLILTRPNVPGGRSIGFFPGTLEEKMDPWAKPLTATIENRMGSGKYQTALKSGNIEVLPFEVMRGRSFENCMVILDEAQNVEYGEMKMFLTRVGEGCRTVLCGDITQKDIKSDSGLGVALGLVRKFNIPVSVTEFTVDDVVRSGMCAQWIRAFERYEHGRR